MTISHFKDLDTWQKAMDFVEKAYRYTANFPASEMYGLTNQLRRAAVSIPSNIAEGAEREGTKEFLRFISIAKGSQGEIETQLILAHRLSFLPLEKYNELIKDLHEIGRMLNGLQRSLTLKVEKLS